MKAIFENQYIQSKAMIREYAGKIVIRKYKKKACFVAALGLVLLLISLLNQNLIMTGVAAACTIICIAVILFLPGLFVKEIEKNTTFLNGKEQPESLLRFGDKIVITEGAAKMEFQYSQIMKLMESTNLYCLMLNDTNGVIVKKDCFIKGDYPQCTRGHMPESSYLLRFLRSLRFTYIQYAHLIGLEIIANSYFQVVESEATDMCRGKAESGQRTGRTLDLLTTHHPEHICGYQTMCIFVH